MQLLPKLLSLIAIAAAATVSTPRAASAVTVPCGTNLKAAALGVQTTASRTFVNMPDAVITFSGGGGKCVVVHFSTQVGGQFPETLGIRAKLNDAFVAFPSAAEFVISGSSVERRAVTFMFLSIGSGDHTLRLQFRSKTGRTIKLLNGLMTVTFDPAGS